MFVRSQAGRQARVYVPFVRLFKEPNVNLQYKA